MYSPARSLSPLLLAVALCACRDPQPRVYSEVAFQEAPEPQAPMAGQMMPPGGMPPGAMPPMMGGAPAGVKVTWTLPQGWTQKDSAMGMRLGSFRAPAPAAGAADSQAVDISVVQLAGEAGGLKPNIIRWMGQVGLISTPESLDELIKAAPRFKTKTGQEGMFVDLTDKLSGDMTQSKTIFGAVIMGPGYTVFVKAMGERSRVIENKKKVMAFGKSLSIRKGPEA